MLTRCTSDLTAPSHAFGAPAATAFFLSGVTLLLPFQLIPTRVDPADSDGRLRDWSRWRNRRFAARGLVPSTSARTVSLKRGAPATLCRLAPVCDREYQSSWR